MITPVGEGGGGSEHSPQIPQLHLGTLTRACPLCSLSQLGPDYPNCNFLVNAMHGYSRAEYLYKTRDLSIQSIRAYSKKYVRNK